MSIEQIPRTPQLNNKNRVVRHEIMKVCCTLGAISLAVLLPVSPVDAKSSGGRSRGGGFPRSSAPSSSISSPSNRSSSSSSNRSSTPSRASKRSFGRPSSIPSSPSRRTERPSTNTRNSEKPKSVIPPTENKPKSFESVKRGGDSYKSIQKLNKQPTSFTSLSPKTEKQNKAVPNVPKLSPNLNSFDPKRVDAKKVLEQSYQKRIEIERNTSYRPSRVFSPQPTPPNVTPPQTLPQQVQTQSTYVEMREAIAETPEIQMLETEADREKGIEYVITERRKTQVEMLVLGLKNEVRRAVTQTYIHHGEQGEDHIQERVGVIVDNIFGSGEFLSDLEVFINATLDGVELNNDRSAKRHEFHLKKGKLAIIMNPANGTYSTFIETRDNFESYNVTFGESAGIFARNVLGGILLIVGVCSFVWISFQLAPKIRDKWYN